MPLKNGNEKKYAPGVAHGWLGLLELCHLKLHSGPKGPGLGGEPANELREAGTKEMWKRWPHLTEPEGQSSPQPSATLLQFGPALCNHSLTIYVGDVQSSFTFINSFDPHNSGEDLVASFCQRRKTEAWPSQDLTPRTPFDPLNQFSLPSANLSPSFKIK